MTEPDSINGSFYKNRLIFYFITTRLYFSNYIWLIFEKSRGLNYFQIAFVDAIFWLTILTLEIPTGIVADKFGRRTSIILSYFTDIGATIIFIFSYSLFDFIVSSIFFGFGITLRSGAEEAWIYDLYVTEQGNSADDFQSLWGTLDGFRYFSVFLAGISGGFIAERYGLVAPNYLIVVSISIGIIITLSIPNNKQYVDIEDNQSGSVKIAVKQLKQKSVLIFVTGSVIFTSVSFSIAFWMQLYMDSIKFSYSVISIILSIGAIFITFGSILSKRISGVSYFTIIRFFFITIISVLGIAYAPHFLIALFFWSFSFIRGAMRPYISKILNKELSTSVRATALSIVGAIATIFTLMFEFIASYFLNRNNFAGFLVSTAIILTLYSVFFVIIYQNNNKKKGAPAGIRTRVFKVKA